jgi:hypothetical protein
MTTARPSRRRAAALLPALLVAVLALGAAAGGELGRALVPRLDPGPRRVLLVMFDGLPQRAFHRALDEGAMPRLASLLAQRPTVSTTAFATFPSSTSPSVPELLSGRYCALDNPHPDAVHAFDREERRVVRYVTEPDAWQWPVANLFDAAHAAGLPAITVFEGRWDGSRSILTRGANIRDAALEVAGITEFDGDRGPVEKLIQEIRGPEPPRVALLVFNATDLSGHFHGPDSVEERQALVNSDELLGEVLTALQARHGDDGRSFLDDTTILLFGDHGMVPSGTALDLEPFFNAQGLATFDASSLSQVIFRERFGRLWTEWPDVLLVSGGSNITQIYFRDPQGGWAPGQAATRREMEKASHRPDAAAEAARIAELPGVAQVLRAPRADEIDVLASGGRQARVLSRPQGDGRIYAYVVDPAAMDDPFGYLHEPDAAPLVCREGAVADRCFLSREEWIARTLACRYPGAPPLLDKALDPPRFTGDLVVTALPGYSFIRGQRGDHGNLERESILTPLILNGPGVDPAHVPALVRLVDIYPTAAVLLGASPRDPALATLDGRSLVGETSQVAVTR